MIFLLTGNKPGEYKDLRQNDSSVRVEDGNLIVENIQKVNEGYYLCEATNGIGSGLSAVVQLNVQAPPEFSEKLRNQTARRGFYLYIHIYLSILSLILLNN